MLYKHRLLLLSCSLCLLAACGGRTNGSSPTSADTNTNPNPTEYCEGTQEWNGDWSVMESQVIVEMNKRRAQGADCRSAGSYPPAPALTDNKTLQCAARNHSVDMSDRDYFAHDSPDGDSVADRADWAGYPWSAIGENLALGSPDAVSVVNGWMGSDGHCKNIMLTDFTEVGIGFHKGKHPLWTAVFGDQ